MLRSRRSRTGSAFWALAVVMAGCGARVAPVVGDVALDGVGDAVELDSGALDPRESVFVELPAADCPEGTWCWHTPSPQGRSIDAVFVASESEAWAVGRNGTVLRYGEGRWTAQPQISTVNLAQIWGAGQDSVWAWGVEPGGGRSDIKVWDGARWSYPVGLDTAIVQDLHGSARDNVWLASGSPERVLLRRWNGTMVVPVAQLPELRRASSVCVRSSTEVWATAVDRGGRPTIIYRFDGASWTLVHTVASGDRLTSKIACPADGVAVVEKRSSDERVSIVEVRATMVSEVARALSEPATFVRTSRGDAYVVSDRAAMRWTPDGWRRAFAGGADRPLTPAFDLSPGGSIGWMANGTPFLAAFSAGVWRVDPQWRFQQLSVFPTIVSGVELTDPTVVFGNLVWALRRPTGWQISRAPVLPTLLRFDALSAWGADTTAIWIAGARGAIAKYDSRTAQMTLATVASSAGAADLYAIHGSDANNVWAVGSSGVVLRLQGERWVAPPVSLPATVGEVRLADVQLDYVYASSATDVVIAGVDTSRSTRGVQLRWNGSAWLNAASLPGLARDEQGRWYAINGRSLVRREPTSDRWTSVGGEPPLPIRKVRARPSGVIEVIVSDGQRMALHELTSDDRLALVGAPIDGEGILDITRGADGSLWAVGAYGAILRYQPRR